MTDSIYVIRQYPGQRMHPPRFGHRQPARINSGGNRLELTRRFAAPLHLGSLHCKCRAVAQCAPHPSDDIFTSATAARLLVSMAGSRSHFKLKDSLLAYCRQHQCPHKFSTNFAQAAQILDPLDSSIASRPPMPRNPSYAYLGYKNHRFHHA